MKFLKVAKYFIIGDIFFRINVYHCITIVFVISIFCKTGLCINVNQNFCYIRMSFAIPNIVELIRKRISISHMFIEWSNAVEIWLSDKIFFQVWVFKINDILSQRKRLFQISVSKFHFYCYFIDLLVIIATVIFKSLPLKFF